MLDEDSDVLSLSSQSNEGMGKSISSMISSATGSKTSAIASSVALESELAQQETKLVKRSKCLVLFVLLAAAAGCGTGKLLMIRVGTENKSLHFCLLTFRFLYLATYLYTDSGEEDNFRDQVSLKEQILLAL